MKIIHIINHTGRFNGNVHAAVDLACEQADQGHDILLISRGGDFADLLCDHGVRHLRVPMNRSLLLLGRVVCQLAAMLRSERPDVVHAHMVTSALVAWPACRLFSMPLIATSHNAFARSASLLRIADRTIAVSGSVATSLVRRGIPRRKIRTVLNGTIGAARRSGLPPPPVELKRPSIVYVGGLHPRKGVVDLIDAFAAVHASLQQCYLYLVGEGPMRADYEALLEGRACRPYVTFAGALPDPRAYFAAADVFVLPSLADPAPLVISEAREAGCAIVASDVDGIPEMLDDGRAGILVPCHTPDALAAAVLRVLADAQSLAFWRERSRIGLAKLTIARAASETIAVYQETLHGRMRNRFGSAEEGADPLRRRLRRRTSMMGLSIFRQRTGQSDQP